MTDKTKNPRIDIEEAGQDTTPVNPPLEPQKGNLPENSAKKKGSKNNPVKLNVDTEVNKLISELNAEIEKVKELRASLEAKDKQFEERLSSSEFLTSQRTEQDIERHKSKAERMRENLKNQPTVRIRVPFDGGEKKGATVPVTLNGLRINVPKGVYIDVPEQIADVLDESDRATENALDNEFRLDKASENKLDALQ